MTIVIMEPEYACSPIEELAYILLDLHYYEELPQRARAVCNALTLLMNHDGETQYKLDFLEKMGEVFGIDPVFLEGVCGIKSDGYESCKRQEDDEFKLREAILAQWGANEN